MNLGHPHLMDQRSAVNRNKPRRYITTWVNVKEIQQSEKSQPPMHINVCSHLQNILERTKLERRTELVVEGVRDGVGGRNEWSCLGNMMGHSGDGARLYLDWG